MELFHAREALDAVKEQERERVILEQLADTSDEMRLKLWRRRYSYWRVYDEEQDDLDRMTGDAFQSLLLASDVKKMISERKRTRTATNYGKQYRYYWANKDEINRKRRARRAMRSEAQRAYDAAYNEAWRRKRQAKQLVRDLADAYRSYDKMMYKGPSAVEQFIYEHEMK